MSSGCEDPNTPIEVSDNEIQITSALANADQRLAYRRQADVIANERFSVYNMLLASSVYQLQALDAKQHLLQNS